MEKYVPAIDGLRALAVSLVLFFHAGFSFAGGGFIGVDVFFVISGFLITGIIYRDLVARKWTFTQFYLRRLVRLTPALFVTVLITLGLSYFVLAPDDLERLGKTALYTSFSVSNIFFWLEAGYFDQAAATKPLLHTWSLGVEEQFYLLWPVIIFLLVRWRTNFSVTQGVAIIGGISFIVALSLSKNHPQAVFYLMPHRIYQFALGGLVALISTGPSSRAQSIFGLVGVSTLLLIANIGSGTGSTYWLVTAVPAFAAAIVVWCSKTIAVKALFTLPPLLWVGRRSYSIYLVHWPVIVLWPMATDFELSGLEAILAIGLSILLGAVLHDTVEFPIRFKSTTTLSQRRRSYLVVVSLFVGCTTVAAFFTVFSGFPQRVPAEMRVSADDVENLRIQRRKAIRRNVCAFSGQRNSLDQYKHNICAKPPLGKSAYMVIGDSLGSDAYMVLAEAFPDVYFGQLTIGGCLLKSPNSPPFKQENKFSTCGEYYDHAFDISISRNFDGVVFAGNWQEVHTKVFEELVKWTSDNGLDVIFFSHRPRFKERIPSLVMTSIRPEQARQRANSLLSPGGRESAKDMVEKLAGRAKVVDMHQLMCGNGCDIYDEAGRLIYVDQVHLTTDGATWVADKLTEAYSDIILHK